MILVPFFEILYGGRLAKNIKSQYVQVIPRSTDCVNKKIYFVKILKPEILKLSLLCLIVFPLISRWKCYHFTTGDYYWCNLTYKYLYSRAKSRDTEAHCNAWYKRYDSCFDGILAKELRNKQQVEKVSPQLHIMNVKDIRFWVYMF